MTNPNLARDYFDRAQKRLKSEDVTPSTFYTAADAAEAKAMAEEVRAGVSAWLAASGPATGAVEPESDGDK